MCSHYLYNVKHILKKSNKFVLNVKKKEKTFFFSLPIDVNISRLSNSVAPVLSLGIHGWVPITVIEHHCISPSQVNTNTSTAGGQDEAEYATICIESLHQSLKSRQIFQ